MNHFLRRLLAAPFSRLMLEHQRQIDDLKLLLGRNLSYQVKQHGLHGSIHDVEFRVFSQFGDDGIIQYLTNVVSIPNKTFIEFGVQNYTESNTRFLLMNNNWSGLVMDSSTTDIGFIKQDPIYWRHDLKAVCAFVNRGNIDTLITENGFGGEIGILSIDIDGNDYWVWDAIGVVVPTIVIAEYNSVFGADHAITVPYDPAFCRTKAHHSNLYWGCSLKALFLLAEKKGYSFIGSNSNGNNAYFVRSDRVGQLHPLELSTGYVESKIRDSRDVAGRLTFAGGSNRLRIIEDMPVFDVESGKLTKIKDLRQANGLA